MRKPKVHLRSKAIKSPFNTMAWAVCNSNVIDASNITDDGAKVTCAKCLRLLDKNTGAGFHSEQGGPKDNGLVDLFITTNGPNRISVIRVIRELTGLGLKESKDFSDQVRDDGPQVLMIGVTLEKAHQARIDLLAAGAGVELRTAEGHVVGDTPSPIEQAYREMIECFVPDEKYRSHLLGGNAPLYWAARSIPATKDVRRWLAAGGAR